MSDSETSHSSIQDDAQVESTSCNDSSMNSLIEALSKVVGTRDRPRIPSFSGRSSSTPIDEWLYIVRKFINSLKYQQYGEDDKKEVVFNSLNHEARSRFMRLDQQHFKLEDILIKFENCYSECVPPEDLLQSLYNCRQVGSETISDFSDKLENLLYKVEIIDSSQIKDRDITLKSIFLKGLKDRGISELLRYLKKDSSITFEYMRAEALEFEKSRRERSCKPVSSAEEVNVSLTDKVKMLETELKTLKTDQQQIQSSSISPNTQLNHTSSEQQSSFSHQPRSQMFEHGPPTYQQRTWRYPTQPGRPTPRCYHCNETGHIQRFCPKQRSNSNLN